MDAASHPSLIIEKLTQHHGLLEFDCGNAQLNNWLKRFAWTNQRAETGKTYVPTGTIGLLAITRWRQDPSLSTKRLSELRKASPTMRPE